MSSDKEDWKVGDRVQHGDWNNGKVTWSNGAITEVIKGTREVYGYSYGGYSRREAPKTEEYIESAKVKWDDGEEEVLKCFDFQREDSPLEREFRSHVEEVSSKINEKLALASKYLNEACSIADAEGVAFDSSVSPLYQGYRPALSKKFVTLDEDFVKEATQVHNEYEGWQHSAVCN